MVLTVRAAVHNLVERLAEGLERYLAHAWVRQPVSCARAHAAAAAGLVGAPRGVDDDFDFDILELQTLHESAQQSAKAAAINVPFLSPGSPAYSCGASELSFFQEDSEDSARGRTAATATTPSLVNSASAPHLASSDSLPAPVSVVHAPSGAPAPIVETASAPDLRAGSSSSSVMAALPRRAKAPKCFVCAACGRRFSELVNFERHFFCRTIYPGVDFGPPR
jgi:hypothetical protein